MSGGLLEFGIWKTGMVAKFHAKELAEFAEAPVALLANPGRVLR